MSNHKAQTQRAKADFVQKLTTWIRETPKHEPSKSLTEAGLLQRILDVHVYNESTTENVYYTDFNRFLIPRIKEKQFMKLRPISARDEYVKTLFGFFWSPSGLSKVKTETRELVQQWLDYPKYQEKFPYSVLGTRGMRDNSRQEPPKAEPKWGIPDSWDDDDAWDDEPKVKPPPVMEKPPVEEFAALAKELGVPFQKGDNVGGAYKKLALLMHPDKHPTEEAEVWTAKMKRLNALRDELLK
jgi:hypothetical protein